MVLSRIISSSLHLNYAVSAIVALFLVGQLFLLGKRFRAILLRTDESQVAPRFFGLNISKSFLKKSQQDKLDELLLYLNCFFDNASTLKCYGKKKSIIEGIIKNAKPTFFKRKRDGCKSEHYLDLAYEAKGTILAILTDFDAQGSFMREADILRLIASKRDDLLMQVGQVRHDLVETKEGRDVSDLLEEIVKSLEIFLLPQHLRPQITYRL